jgi:glycosyltransferase involved in cell wall biosynthesis
VPNTLNFDSFLVNQVSIPELKEKYQSTFNIIYVGGFDVVRGLKYLIEAAAKIKSHIPDLKIILVGDGIMCGELQEQSLNLGLEDIVIFTGWQPSSSIQAYIEIADICIIPHIRSEQTDNSSPNKLFQYMFFKKPVISSNCVSLEKIINQENCGLIFKDKNSNDLSDKILVLYQNSSLKVELGNNGYEAVMEKFNWGKTVQKLLTIYN